jgi:hypothetical protein
LRRQHSVSEFSSSAVFLFAADFFAASATFCCDKPFSRLKPILAIVCLKKVPFFAFSAVQMLSNLVSQLVRSPLQRDLEASSVFPANLVSSLWITRLRSTALSN